MNFPLDRMIDNVQGKTAAVSKNVGKDTRTLDQKVIDIVASANKMALPDRQVVPRNALIVMQRAMNELSSLSDESREAGVLREVNKFISLNQNTFSNSDAYTKHTDLLPAGHPLSDHNYSLSTEDYLQRYAAWLSADPGISDDVRHLVAAAYSQLPGSPKREHAFVRLRVIKASSLPAYFKIDISALVAAFSFGDGNSSAARRARVKLQWRDRFGRWVEMGRGINFKFRLPDGGIGNASGTYVGSDANAGYSGNIFKKEANAGYVEVKGNENVPDGIYSIRNNNAEVFKARLSEADLERAGVDSDRSSKYKISSVYDESIPDLNDLLATKVDAPSGWTKNDDGSFTSDDDYKVVKKDGGYEVYRLDLEGNTGDKVGDAKTWADVQNVAAADEEAYDKYKEDVESGQLPLGDGDRPEPRYSRMNREVQQEIKQLRDQIPQNEESNKRIEDQLERALAGKDSQGRDLPEGWYSKIDPNEISETYYKDIPGATRKDEYLVATVGREGKINYGTGGFWFNNARPTESWDQITEDTPKILDQINQGRASIGLAPIEPNEDKNTKNYSKVDKQIKSLRPGDLIPAYFPTRGGKERLLDERERNPNFEMPPVDEVLQVGTYRGIDPDKVVLRVKNIESGEERRFEVNKNATMYDTRVPSSEPVQTKPVVSDKEIFDRRMAGESLQEVADDLGITREEVRAREAKYARENPIAAPGSPPGPPPKGPRPLSPDDKVVPYEITRRLGDNRQLVERIEDGVIFYKDNGEVFFEPTPFESRIVNKSDIKPLSDTDVVDPYETVQNINNLRQLVRRREDGVVFDKNSGEILFGTDFEIEDEPPTPPSGGLPPKSPAPSNPAAPALFREFDVPAGAFQLRTVEYEPEGRIDEKSTDFTDTPSIIAVRYPLDILVRAFTESLIGNIDENILNEIVDINDDGDGSIPDLSEVQDALEQRAPRADIGRASGAGSLEFNAGSEFVPAEALYNAVWLAGGDPNRVIANAYDAINGDRSNLNKLIQAQGGIPSPEDEKLIIDIKDEIKIIEEVTPADEEIIANTNETDKTDDDDVELPGNLIENIPVEFTNPDYYNYYNMDLAPYIPAVLETDENGATDNPKLIAIMTESADLIQQLQIGIKDGTGSALIRFGDDATSIVPIEAVRDALQYQGINTNDILFKIRDESKEENADSSTLQRNSQRIKDLIEQAGGTVDDETADKIRDAINQEGFFDWSKAVDAEVIDAITEVAGPGILEKALAELVPETPAAAVANYPGPRQPGYTAANTTLDIDGNVISSGMRVIATKDRKQGRVVSIQNDPEYVRVAFDDGTTAVRSAFKIRAIATADGSAPVAAPEASRPTAPTPSTDIAERLDRPTAIAPRIARAGDTVGVNDVDSKVPDEFKDLTQKDVPQTKFSAWGSRDSEIAKAANTRVKLEELENAMREVAAAREERDRDKIKITQDKLNLIAADVYGSREGLSFGAEYYTLKFSAAQVYGFGTPEEIRSGSKKVQMEVSFDVLAQSGNIVGNVRRGFSVETLIAPDGTKTKSVVASNNYMSVTGKNKKKGFASAYNRYMENWYIANDVKKVSVFAAGGRNYQGGFVWALNGFGWASDRGADIKNIINEMSRNTSNADEKAIATRLLNKLSDSYNKDTSRYDLSKAPTPMELALVGWYPGATDWVGKSVMTQTSWNGVKNLVPGAKEQVQATNYSQVKNAERRIQAGQNKPNVSSELIAYISTNDFQTSNLGLSPYVDQIRNALRNNDPLGKLSPDAKTALSKYVSAEMINKDSKVPIEDTFKLRNALNAEYRADYAYSDPFEVGAELSQFTFNDFQNDSTKIENAGYSYRQLSVDESGMNTMWEVTHVASGQVFYVKNEELSRRWNSVRGIAGELEMSILMNAMGMNGTYGVRASSKEEDIIIMSRAGANLPITLEPINASSMLNKGMPSPSGEKYYGDEPKKFIKELKNPEDLLRMSILDMMGNNKDRHDANWMVAYDSTDQKIVIFPVDNSLSAVSIDQGDSEDQMISFLGQEWREDVGRVYENNIPALIALAGKDRAYAMYKNEVQKIINNIDSEIVKPKGEELAALIDKWGTYEAFRDAMTTRLKNLITDGTATNRELKSAMNLGYWG